MLTEAANMTSHAQYLSKHPYHEVSPEDMKLAKKLLEEEAEIVKKAMQHGNVTIDVYGKVWRDCYSQVSVAAVFETDANVFYIAKFSSGPHLVA